MKKSIRIVISFFLLTLNCYSQMPAPTQHLLPNRTILENTFNIFYESVNGTAFIVNGSKGQYLITAKHIFGNIKQESLINVLLKGGKKVLNLSCKIYFHKNPHVDIAVLKLESPISNGEILPLGTGKDYFLAQECLFLGFPLFNLGTETEIGKIPFVKRAIISAFHEENNVRIMLLDGYNNSGFSGGPIITYSENMDKQFIVGVISGYINQPQKVNMTSGAITNQFSINENSGIIISYTSEYIAEIIAEIEK